MGYGVGQLRIYLSRGISLETGKPTVYTCVCVCFWSTRLLRRQKMKATSFCAVSKLDLLDKFGEDCFSFSQCKYWKDIQYFDR